MQTCYKKIVRFYKYWHVRKSPMTVCVYIYIYTHVNNRVRHVKAIIMNLVALCSNWLSAQKFNNARHLQNSYTSCDWRWGCTLLRFSRAVFRSANTERRIGDWSSFDFLICVTASTSLRVGICAKGFGLLLYRHTSMDEPPSSPAVDLSPTKFSVNQGVTFSRTKKQPTSTEFISTVKVCVCSR